MNLPEEKNEIRANEAIASKIVGGTFWVMLQLGATQGAGLIVKLALVRLLLPAHFGIVGMAVVFTGLFAVIGDLGMGAALVQIRQDRLQAIHWDTAFWLSLAFNGIVWIALLVVIAPIATWFYDEPVLRSVIPVLGFSLCVTPLGLIQRILLTRELRFKPLAGIDVSGALISGVLAVGLAWGGAGVWSIVFQSVFSALITVPLLWRAVPWRPSARFSFQAAKDIVAPGVYDALQRTSVFFSKNFDYLLIGKLLGKEALGLYSLAFILTDTFRQQVMSVLNRVMFPIYGRLQDDTVAIKKYYLTVVRCNTLLLMPFMMVFLVFARPMIVLLFGEHWQESVFPLRAMAIASIIHVMGGTSDAILKGLGRFELNFKIFTYTTLIVDLPAYFAATYFYGINGMAVAVILSRLSTRIVYQYYLHKLLGVKITDIARSVAPALSAGSAIALAGIAIMHAVPADTLLALAFAIGSCVLIYALLVYPFTRNDLRFLRAMLTGSKDRRT